MSAGARRGTLLGAACALALLALTACNTAGSNDARNDRDLRATDRAVKAASPRVVDVTDRYYQIDGLGQVLYFKIQLDSTTPVSAEDLDAIAGAIWTTSPSEPNSIALQATADEAGAPAVDLREAAEQLSPMLFRPFGQEGVSLIAMWKRYGKWEKPE